MSQFSITQYHSEVEKIIQYGGTNKESAISHAFSNLLNEYAKTKGLMLVQQATIKTPAGKTAIRGGQVSNQNAKRCIFAIMQ